jgi:hypothetical protein
MFLAGILGVVLPLAALLGFSVRAIINWSLQRRLDPLESGPAPVWAIVCVAGLMLAAAWSHSTFW